VDIKTFHNIFSFGGIEILVLYRTLSIAINSVCVISSEAFNVKMLSTHTNLFIRRKLGNSGLILSPDTFPHLASLKGRTLITSDGTTILGADDKAGIAEILTMIEYITAWAKKPIEGSFSSPLVAGSLP